MDVVVGRELAELGLAEDVASEVRRVKLLVECAGVGGEEVEGVDGGSIGLLVDLRDARYQFCSVLKSTARERRTRGNAIIRPA